MVLRWNHKVEDISSAKIWNSLQSDWQLESEEASGSLKCSIFHLFSFFFLHPWFDRRLSISAMSHNSTVCLSWLSLTPTLKCIVRRQLSVKQPGRCCRSTEIQLPENGCGYFWVKQWLTVGRNKDAQLWRQTALTSGEKRRRSESSSSVSSENAALFWLYFLLFFLSHLGSEQCVYIQHPPTPPPLSPPPSSWPSGPCEKEEVELWQWGRLKPDVDVLFAQAGGTAEVTEG